MSRRLLLWSVRRPKAAVVVALVATLVFAAFASQVQHRYEIEDFFPRGTAERAAYERAVEAFGRDDRAGLLVVELERPLDADALGVVDAVTRRLAAFEDVERVVSAASALVPERRADGDVRLERAVPYRGLTGGTSVVSPERFKELMAAFEKPPYAGALLSEDRKLAVVAVVLREDRLDFAPRAKLLAELNAERDTLRALGYEAHVAGYPVQRVRLARLAASQSSTYLPVALGLILLMLAVVFRSPASVVLPLLVALGAAVWTTGLMKVLGLPPNIFSPAVYVMVVVVGVADSVHLLTRERELRAEGRDPADALRQAMIDVGPACFFASLTTGLAFASLLFTTIPMIAHMGLQVALGVFAAFVLTMLLAPGCVRWLGRESKGGGRLTELTAGLERWVSRHPGKVALAFGAVFVASVALATRVEVNAPLLADLDEAHPIRKTNRLLEERLSGVIPLDLVIEPPTTHSPDSTSGRATRSPYALEHMNRVDALTRRLRAMPEVLWATSSVDPLDRLGALLKRVPETEVHGLLPTALLLAHDQVRPWVDADSDLQRIRLRVRDLDTHEAFALFERIDRARSEELGSPAYLTGQGYLAQVANRDMVQHFQTGFLVALLGVALTLLVCFRDVRLALLSLIPNLFAVVVVAGLMGLLGIELRYTSALVLSVVFGLAVDDTIHFLAQLRRQRTLTNTGELGGTPDPVSATCRVAGPGLILTSVLLAVGFGALATAAFLPLRIMGGLLALTVALALAADLLLLPALLRLLERDGRSS